jgi:predicted  nucleic acid-binding Zn-ribbon protein
MFNIKIKELKKTAICRCCEIVLKPDTIAIQIPTRDKPVFICVDCTRILYERLPA